MEKNKKYEEEKAQHSVAQVPLSWVFLKDREEEELWREMAVAQESSMVTVENSQARDLKEKKQVEECEHSFIYIDDTGEVSCVCGLIKKPAHSIIEVVFSVRLMKLLLTDCGI